MLARSKWAYAAALVVGSLIGPRPVSGDEAAMQDKIAAAKLCAAEFLGVKAEELRQEPMINRFADGGLGVMFEKTGGSGALSFIRIERNGRLEVEGARWGGVPRSGSKPVENGAAAVVVARQFLKEKGISLKARGLADTPEVKRREHPRSGPTATVSWQASLKLPGMEALPFTEHMTVEVALSDGRVTSYSWLKDRPARIYHQTVSKEKALEIARGAVGEKTSGSIEVATTDLGLYNKWSSDPEVDGKQWLAWTIGLTVGPPHDKPKSGSYGQWVVIDAENGNVLGTFF